MIDPILDPILVPVRDRLRQQDAAIRSAQARADDSERVVNQQRAEIERLSAKLAAAQRRIAEHDDAIDAYAHVLAAYTDLHEAALAWRTAISVPDGVRAAEERLLAALERIDEASEG